MPTCLPSYMCTSKDSVLESINSKTRELFAAVVSPVLYMAHFQAIPTLEIV